MRDSFGRLINYLRISVTDRCDFRCTYCMSEKMQFLPREDLLSIEELSRVCTAFIKLGVKKIRVTGGEPLVRRDIMSFFRSLKHHLDEGRLEEIVLTTNGSQLARYADDLYENGVRRVNVSLDTLVPDKFKLITRLGCLDKVLAGIETAQKAGLKVKINTVALNNFNRDEISNLVTWCGAERHDLTFIEVMPMGDIGNEQRFNQFLSLDAVRHEISKLGTLKEIDYNSGGPARYCQLLETGQRIGFITPLSHNFCASCNRVRLTCTGQLFMCLGRDNSADLRTELRKSKDNQPLHDAILDAITAKPKEHDFVIKSDSKPAVMRHMSVTGG